MVIKFTVQDNDYYYCLQAFIKSLFRGVGAHPSKFKTVDEFFSAEDTYNRFMRLLGPNNDEKLTGEDKRFILDYIRNRFDTYLKTCNYDDEERSLLNKDFKVRIQKSYVDRWENGESFYWLQHFPYVIINQ